jgi:hypothetical protein
MKSSLFCILAERGERKKEYKFIVYLEYPNCDGLLGQLTEITSFLLPKIGL